MAEPRLEVVGVEEVQSLLKKLPGSVFEDVKAVFKDAVFNTYNKVRAQLDGSPLKSRTGEMRRSFKTQLTGTSLENIKASVFSGAGPAGSILVYVPVHEFGATGANAIVAKRAYKKVPGGPYLNIPLSANLTEKAGVMRKSAGEVFSEGGFIFQSRSKKWFVAAKDGTPMFILKKKVEIKARLGFYDIADKELAVVQKRLADILPKSWRNL